MNSMSVIGYEEARSAIKANRKYNVYHGLGLVVKAGRSLRRELFDKVIPYRGAMRREDVYLIESDNDTVNLEDVLNGSMIGHQVRRKSDWKK